MKTVSLSYIILPFILLISLNSVRSLEIRTEGDSLYRECQNITEDIGVAKFTIKDACVQLKEGANCSIKASLSIENNVIFDKELSSEVSPQVCGTYLVPVNGGNANCDICLRVDSTNTTHRCIVVQPTCTYGSLGPFNLPASSAGCFPNSVLQNVIDCRSEQCPNMCSGQGACNAGQCECNSGWFGSDCSVSKNLFEQCQKIDNITGSVCVRLVFDRCMISTKIVLQSGYLEIPLYSRDLSVTEFKTVFQNDVAFNATGCANSFGWNNLVVNETQVSGCGHMKLRCFGTQVASYDLGCFLDKDVLPACIGLCPNNCTNHGTCVNGICSCSKGWTTSDCSMRGCPTPDCGGSLRGTCVDGECQCTNNYSGDNCENYAGPGAPSPTSGGSGIGIKVAIALSAALILGVAGVVIFIRVRRWRRSPARFAQRFELLENDDEELQEK